MAARKEVERAGGSWNPVHGCAVAVGSTSEEPAQPDEDEVECLSQSTRSEAEAVRHRRQECRKPSTLIRRISSLLFFRNSGARGVGNVHLNE